MKDKKIIMEKKVLEVLDVMVDIGKTNLGHEFFISGWEDERSGFAKPYKLVFKVVEKE